MRGRGTDKMASQRLRRARFGMLVGSFPGFSDQGSPTCVFGSLAPPPPGCPLSSHSYMTGPSSPSCSLKHLLGALHTFPSADPPGSYLHLQSELHSAPSYSATHGAPGPAPPHLPRSGCCIAPCKPALCPVSPGRRSLVIPQDRILESNSSPFHPLNMLQGHCLLPSQWFLP